MSAISYSGISSTHGFSPLETGYCPIVLQLLQIFQNSWKLLWFLDLLGDHTWAQPSSAVLWDDFQAAQSQGLFSYQLLVTLTSAIHSFSPTVHWSICGKGWVNFTMCYGTVWDINCVKDGVLAKHELIDHKTKIILDWNLTQKSLERS